MTRRVVFLVPAFGNDHLHVASIVGAFRPHMEEIVVRWALTDGLGVTRDGSAVVDTLKPDVVFLWPGWALSRPPPSGTTVVLVTADLHAVSGVQMAEYTAYADLIIVRAPQFRYRLPHHPRVHWLRWSVPAVAETWVPWSTRREVGFLGALGVHDYPSRTHLVKMLDGLVDVRLRHTDPVPSTAMMHWWARHRVGITCGSRFHFPVAKHIEIAAAGCALLTDGEAVGLSALLEPDMYTTYTATETPTSARALLNDCHEEQARRAHEHVRQHHLHRHRRREVYELLAEIRSDFPPNPTTTAEST